MSNLASQTGLASRPAGRWPGRPLLAARLREILRREFGAADAWVVHARGRCRLEARIGWTTVVLLEGDEETFWAPFYTSVVRTVHVRGEVVAQPAPTQRPRRDLVETLRPLWAEAVEKTAVVAGPTPPN